MDQVTPLDRLIGATETGTRRGPVASALRRFRLGEGTLTTNRSSGTAGLDVPSFEACRILEDWAGPLRNPVRGRVLLYVLSWEMVYT